MSTKRTREPSAKAQEAFSKLEKINPTAARSLGAYYTVDDVLNALLQEPVTRAPFTVRLPIDLIEQIKAKAEAEGISTRDFVTEALYDSVDR